MYYPCIAVMPRVKGFSVEIRDEEDVAGWETWYNGTSVEDAIHYINVALKKYPNWSLYIEDRLIKGYQFRVRREDNSLSSFFRGVDTVSNPFYNRKVYQNANSGSTVNFRSF